jgi:hypothetical protein
MNDTPEIVRQQMEQTRSQLVEKLESLELQVSETVKSTGTAVNATVEAVQETVESVTGAVQSAVQSVSNAFDVRRQFDRHPWLILSGSVALGYLAVEFLAGSAQKSQRQQETAPLPDPSADNAGLGNGEPPVESAATAIDTTGSHESGRKSSSRHQLRSAAVSVLIGIVQELASRAVPVAMDYLTESGKVSTNQTLDQDKAPIDAEQMAEAKGADRNGCDVNPGKLNQRREA